MVGVGVLALVDIHESVKKDESVYHHLTIDDDIKMNLLLDVHNNPDMLNRVINTLKKDYNAWTLYVKLPNDNSILIYFKYSWIDNIKYGRLYYVFLSDDVITTKKVRPLTTQSFNEDALRDKIPFFYQEKDPIKHENAYIDIWNEMYVFLIKKKLN